jgi:thymidylate synthase
MDSYLHLMRHVLDHGVKKTDRTGTEESQRGIGIDQGRVKSYQASRSILLFEDSVYRRRACQYQR